MKGFYSAHMFKLNRQRSGEPLNFAGGGGGTATEEEQKAALLATIQDRVKTEIETRGYQNAEAVNALFKTALANVNLEALRNFDPAKQDSTLKNIAAELEKIKNIRLGGEAPDKEMLKRAVTMLTAPGKDGAPCELELMMRNKGQNGTKEIVLNLRVAANMTTGNTVNENNYPLEMIESMDMLQAVVLIRRGVQYIFDIATRNVVADLEQYTTWLEEGDEQGGFAYVAEGAVKPLVSGALVRNFAKAKKIAAKTVVTEEFVKFRAKIWVEIQKLINLKLLRDYAALLTADLQAQAASYVGTSLDGTIVLPTDYDAIGAVAAQIETLNFAPDILIIHPQDKWRLTLEKDSIGQYYMMVPIVQPDGVIRMMGFRLITSTYQTIGTFTLGESGLFQIEEEALTMRMGYGIDVTTAVVNGTNVVTSVKSDFDSNQMRMIVETYFKDWIATPHIGSFVSAAFATVKAALLKP